MPRRTAGAAGSALIATLLPLPAAAHSLSGRVQSPLPFEAYLIGAAVAVALSFAFVALGAGRSPRLPQPGRPRVVPTWLRLGLRAVGLLAWLWVLAQVLLGGSSEGDVSSLFLWTYGWIGLALVSALVGPAWEWLDPFTTLHDLGAAIFRRLGVAGLRPQPYPERLGAWPAVIGLGFFVWLELVAMVGEGRTLGIVMLGYTAVTLAGMAQYGRDPWRRQAETFGVWFGLLGRMAPIALAEPPLEHAVRVRRILSGLLTAPWSVPLVIVVSIGTGSIIYDGLSQTRTFFDLFGIPGMPLATGLLLAFLAALAALVVATARRVGVAAVGAGLVPVALGYLVAHYLTTLLEDGQRIFIAISDPFQQGADLFGTAFWEPRIDFLANEAVWAMQVGAVIVGHVLGAWAGHAAVQMEEAEGARVSQVPLAVLMVGLTTLTLWSLGQNLVFEMEPGEGAGSAPATMTIASGPEQAQLASWRRTSAWTVRSSLDPPGW